MVKITRKGISRDSADFEEETKITIEIINRLNFRNDTLIYSTREHAEQLVDYIRALNSEEVCHGD